MLLAGLVALVGVAAVILAQTSGAHRGFTPESIKGRWGFSEEYVVGSAPGFAAGIFRFDGKGECWAQWSQAGGVESPQDFNSAQPCEYTIDKEGKGTITAPNFSDIRFVLTQHGRLIRYAWCCDQSLAGRGEMNRM